MQSSPGQGAQMVNQSPNQRIQKVPNAASGTWYMQQQTQQPQQIPPQQQGMVAASDINQVSYKNLIRI